jgi:hypothetical protein
MELKKENWYSADGAKNRFAPMKVYNDMHFHKGDS